MPDSMSVSEFKATCLKVIDRVKKTGMPVIVTKRGEPYALVTSPPEPEKSKSWIGQYREEIKITGNILEPASSDADWDALK
ncbi:MAG: prevent-host-death family protein [Acidobacteria bacterium]|nr:MAG: prevent-host-death family protein [Acidobacteriota bacterium]